LFKFYSGGAQSLCDWKGSALLEELKIRNFGKAYTSCGGLAVFVIGDRLEYSEDYN